MLTTSQNHSKNHIFGKSFWTLLRLVSDRELDIEIDTELDIELDIEQYVVPISALWHVIEHCG